MKTRNQKALEYEEKYSEIPRDYNERISYLYDKLKITPNQHSQILVQRDNMMNALFYSEIRIVLYEDPEGSPRPRFRLVNRYNVLNQALTNSNFVHVYSVTGAADNAYMKRLVTENELYGLEQLIYTPCDMIIDLYIKTPGYFNRCDTVLAEIGLERPIVKPDWDNAGKKYSDMFNANIWLDDRLVIDGQVRKFYSILPRVEITLNYLNMLYNRQQALQIAKSMTTDSPIIYFNNGGGQQL
jgi:Holliday junction resolvase RusA-like endonuclease